MLWVAKWLAIFTFGIIVYAVLATAFIGAGHHVEWDSDPCPTGCIDSR